MRLWGFLCFSGLCISEELHGDLAGVKDALKKKDKSQELPLLLYSVNSLLGVWSVGGWCGQVFWKYDTLFV